MFLATILDWIILKDLFVVGVWVSITGEEEEIDLVYGGGSVRLMGSISQSL